MAARTDIQRIKVLKAPVDLHACVNSAVAAITESWPSPTVKVRHDGDLSRPACADNLRVGQIIRNLLQNAHRDGGDDIEVRIHYTSDTCVITVSDDGPGVPSDKRPTTNAQGSGTPLNNHGYGHLLPRRHITRSSRRVSQRCL